MKHDQANVVNYQGARPLPSDDAKVLRLDERAGPSALMAATGLVVLVTIIKLCPTKWSGRSLAWQRKAGVIKEAFRSCYIGKDLG